MAAIEYNFFQTRLLLVLLNFNKEKVHFFPPLYSKTRELKSLGQKNKSCLAISGLKVTINLKLVVNYNVFINLFYVGFLVSVLTNTPSSHQEGHDAQWAKVIWNMVGDLNLVYNIFILYLKQIQLKFWIESKYTDWKIVTLGSYFCPQWM